MSLTSNQMMVICIVGRRRNLVRRGQWQRRRCVRAQFFSIINLVNHQRSIILHITYTLLKEVKSTQYVVWKIIYIEGPKTNNTYEMTLSEIVQKHS